MIPAAWICIFSPLVGAALTPVLGRVDRRLRDFGAVFFSLVSAVAALTLLPLLVHPEGLPLESSVVWLDSPIEVSFGVLLDPLSVILANVVAVISFVIMVYCVGYMHGDAGQTRFWMWMNLFIGSMLLLVLSHNLLFLFIGWKLVGLCSYGLIGFYYRDEEKYWIGGPPPTKFVTPSEACVKALVVTGVGDMLMLGGILIVYCYSGTLNILELYATLPQWLPEMASSPGMVILVSVLLLAGPVGKSAQFPLHEWLPEAMAGPGPVSALIHAATMVKSGVYLVARFVPIFYYGYWVADVSEASWFFYLAAWIGAITAFLAATQGMVSLELKKIMAYSTVSQIGYMMLALGVAGMSPVFLVSGFSSGVFHLVSHAMFKACLFLCAGTVIHAVHSIYVHEMGSLRRFLPFTWLFMLIAALSLVGFPPSPGFWSKDAVLLTALAANKPLFVLALATVAVTAFYTLRMFGMVFHGAPSENVSRAAQHDSKMDDGRPTMWIASGVLAVMTVVAGIGGPMVEHVLHDGFSYSLVTNLSLPVQEPGQHVSHWLVSGLALSFVAVGAVPAYLMYVSRRISPGDLIERYGALRALHRFFWNRWYIDGFYNRAFVDGTLKLAWIVAEKIEEKWDAAMHVKLPIVVTERIYAIVKQMGTESGQLLYGISYILVFLIFLISVFFSVLGN